MLSNIDDDSVKVVWHKEFFDACKSNLSNDEYSDMIDELNSIVDDKINNGEDVVVSSFIPGRDWTETVWNPIYTKACGYDEEYSAQFFGLLVCQVLIDRKETWRFIRQDIARSMIYFIPRKKFSVDDLKNKFGA